MKLYQILTFFLIALLVVPIGLAQSVEHDEYDILRSNYHDLRDDYDHYSDRYDDAVDDDDSSDMRYYERKLDGIYDDLDELDGDVDYLTDDVEGNSTIPDRNNLLRDLDNLRDDIRRLQRRIVDVTEDDRDPWASELIVMPPEEEVEEVVVPQLVFVDIDRPMVEEVNEGWSETRTLLWLALGIIIVLALIIFLIAVIV